jgi:hypothetical protein
MFEQRRRDEAAERGARALRGHIGRRDERTRQGLAQARSQGGPQLRHSLHRRLQQGCPTVYIDRHLPRSFRSWTSRVYVTPFLLTHEIVEKALLDELGLHYLHARQIGLRTERAAVEAAGISWRIYEGFMKRHEKPIEEEKLQRVPRDLDLTPYRDMEDFQLLQNLVTRERRPHSKVRRARQR